MTISIATLAINIIANTSGLTQGLTTATQKTTSFAQGIQNVGAGVTKTGKTLTTGITLPVLAMGFAAQDAAVDLQESINKSQVVFGEFSSDIITFADTSAESWGIAKADAIEAAGTYGNLFTTAGLAEGAAADMSIATVQLASDLASFNNIDPTAALDKLQSGLTGEVRPLKSMGILISATAVKLHALEQGFVDAEVDAGKLEKATNVLTLAQDNARAVFTDAGADSAEYAEALGAVEAAEAKVEEVLEGKIPTLTEAQKLQARFSLIMEQSSNAQGDFARTSEMVANQQRITKAEFDNLLATVGAFLIPIILELMTILQGLMASFMNLTPAQQQMILLAAGIAAAIGPALIIVGSLISAVGAIIPVVTAVVGLFTGPVLLVIAAVVAGVLLMVTWWNLFKDQLTTMWNAAQPVFEAIREMVEVALAHAISFLQTTWEAFSPVVEKTIQWWQDNMVPLFEKIGELMNTIIIVAFEAFGAFIENVLTPAIESMWEWLEDNLLPVLVEVADWLDDKLSPAFETASGWIEDIIGWIDDLISGLEGLELPDWLKSNSPTPFEVGLKGINDEMSTLAGQNVPGLESSLGSLDSNVGSVPGVGGGGGGNGYTIVIENINAQNAAGVLEAAELGVTKALRAAGAL